jgi:hypothetical protein
MRLQEIRDRMLRMSDDKQFNQVYKQIWVSAHTLSAPASTFPWPDTYAVASYCMLLELLKDTYELETQINNLENVQG